MFNSYDVAYHNKQAFVLLEHNAHILGSSPPCASDAQRERINRIIGARIRLRREALGMSARELGAMIGATAQQIQKYEVGANRVSAGSLFDCAEALRVSIDWFFKGALCFSGKMAPLPPKSPELISALSSISDERHLAALNDLAKSLAKLQ